MKGSGFFDLEDKTLIISCAGNLTVRGDVGSSVRYVSDSGDDDQYDAATGRFESDGNAALRVPHYASLIVEHVGGNAQVKGLDGSMTIDGEVGGNLTVSTVNGGLTAHGVGGSLNVKHSSGSLTVKGDVGGDFNVKHSGDVTVGRIAGNANMKHIHGDIAIEYVGSNAAARHMNGDITIDLVEGDVNLSHIGGAINVTSNDDIRFSGPLSAEKHTLNAKSRIDLYNHSSGSLTVTAQAPTIVNNINFDQIVEEDGTLHGSLGEDGAMVTLTAGERITLRGHGHKHSSDGWETFANIEFDFGDEFDFSELNQMGEKISAEVNARMEEFSKRLTPEMNQYAERAIRRAQETVDRVVERMERELERAAHQTERAAHRAERAAHRRTRHRPPTPPVPPVAPVPPVPPKGKADTSAAQLKILKMLEEDKITVEQANELLAALD